jgi:hypothetical protein
MPETEVTTRQKQRGSRSLLAEVKRFLGFTTKNEVGEQPSRGNQATAHKREMEVSRQGSPPASNSNWSSIKNSRTHSQNENLKIVFAVLIGFFVSVSLLGGTVYEFSFWVTALIVGFLLWNVNHVSVDLFRILMALCLIIILNSSLGRPMNFLPDASSLKGTSQDTTVEVRSSAVNIREAPNTDSGIVFTAQQGDELKVIDKRGSWYKVRTGSGTTGWVHSSLVT